MLAFLGAFFAKAIKATEAGMISASGPTMMADATQISLSRNETILSQFFSYLQHLQNQEHHHHRLVEIRYPEPLGGLEGLGGRQLRLSPMASLGQPWPLQV